MKITPEEILSIVSDYYNLNISQIQSETRKAKIVYARHIYNYLAKTLTIEKTEYIGLLIKKDRTTVLHSVKKISNEIQLYSDIVNDVFLLTERISENKLVIKDIDLLQLSINYTKSFLNKIITK